MNPRRKLFVNAYLGEARGNATKAAIAAGYSEHTAKQQGSRLLTKTDVRAAIGLRLKKADIKTDRILERLGRVVHTEAEIKGSDVVNAAKVLLQVSGALQEKQHESRITVNIGFLTNRVDTQYPVIDVTSEHGATAQLTTQLMPPRASVTVPHGE